MSGLFQRLRRQWQDTREARILARRSIPDALWALTLQRLPFLAERSAEDLAELRRLSSLFLDRKEFSGAGGLEVSDDMAVAIAAQACLPVLRFGIEAYDGFVGIVVHPDEVVAPREWVDEAGVAHAWEEPLVGEVMPGGPLMLSWHHVVEAVDESDWPFNVVIHEFAHLLDQADGLEPDGVPPLPDAAARAHWQRVIGERFEAFADEVAHGDDTLLDPYGAESVDEFFAVASEAFFVSPQDLRDWDPALYALLASFYRQDPAAWRAG